MFGIFSTLGSFLLIVAGISIGALLLSALTGIKRVDNSILWGIFWAALITGVALLLVANYLLPSPQ